MGKGFHTDVDGVIAALAAARHGVVTTAELAKAGVDREVIARRTRAGLLVRHGRGVYVLPVLADRWADVAAVQARIPGAVAAGRTAAALHRLDGFDGPEHAADPPDLIGLATGGGRRGCRRVRVLAPSDVTVVDGLRVTTPLRTLFDLASAADRLDRLDRPDRLDRLERAVECALRRRLCAEADFWPAADQPGWHGSRPLRELLRRRGRDTRPTESDLETRFLQLVARPSELEVVARQVNVYAGPTFLARRDFFLAGWVNVETDGAIHATPEAKQRDSAMDLRLSGLGVQVARLSFDDVVRRPRTSARRLEAVVAAGRRVHAEALPLAGGELHL